MRLLSIVERELRAAARQPKTWWRRVLTMGAALVVFAFVYLTVGQWTSLNGMGRSLFSALSAVGVLYALLAGPLATVDCLSRERREGTLGLLFLTDLRSYDVVLGKTAAASLNIVLDLTAALPVVAIPMLMGGVSLRQLLCVMLALVTITFLSLATGVCASSLFTSARASLAVTLGVLFFLSVGLVFVGDEILKIQMDRPAGPYFYMFCPLCAMAYCIDGFTNGTPMWHYWLNIGGMNALGWTFLFVACRRTANSWRDLPASIRELRWRARLERWKRGSAASRLAWRGSMLERNPVSWLEGRDRLQERMLWGIILVSAIFWAIRHVQSPKEWPDEGWLVTWPMLAQCVLCLWIAIQAPRRLADDKQSGALELLLCTPTTPGEIVGGSMRILRRRFGRAMGALVALDVFLAVAYFSEHGGGWEFWHNELFVLAICALVVFPVQAYSLTRIGLYEGLVRSNSVRATFMAIWKVGLLPWVLLIVFMLTWDTVRRLFGALPVTTVQRASAVWAGAHMLPCSIFLAHASWRLHRNFRSLAAQSASPGWWKRWSHSRWSRG